MLRAQLLGHADSLPSRFFRLSVINVLSSITISLAGLVDAAFLGHLANIEYLAAVALVTVIFNLIYNTFKLLRWGTTGITAQAVGASDQNRVLLAVLRNGLLALGISLVLLLAQYPIRELGFLLLNAEPTVREVGIDYFNARIWGAPAVLLNFVLLGWFMGREREKPLLLLSVIGSVSNIILDYLFIVRWGWQSAGAGAATALSQYLMLVAGIIFFSIEGWWPRVNAIKSSIFERNAIQDLLKLSGDLFFARLFWVVTISGFTTVSGTIGTLVLTINTLLIQTVYLAIDFLEGLAFATEVLSGKLKGENASKQFTSLLKLSGTTASAMALVFSLPLIFLSDSIFALLTNHAEVISEVHHYLLWVFPIIEIWALTLVLQGYFLGMAEGELIRNSIMIAMLAVFIPTSIVAWQFHNNQMLWLALLLFLAVRVLVLALQVPASLRSQDKPRPS